jgi:hypothetical protein
MVGGCRACATGQCVDGVCCDTPCTALCQACSAARKGSGSDGACGPIAAGNDPDDDCVADPPASCDRNGYCDGAGACQLWPAGTDCGQDPYCNGNTAFGGEQCDGAGQCLTLSGVDCTPFVCTAGYCPSSCSSDGQCAQSQFCDAGTCAPKLPQGGSCAESRQCLSGFCADGLCCDGACSGVCLACSAAKKGGGADGACGPVAAGGDPDSECAADAANPCGLDGECSGSGSCRQAPSTTACGTASCAGGVLTGMHCDGGGTCVAGAPVSCAPYACASPTACAGSCAADTDCADGAWCDTGDSTCRPKAPDGTACVAGKECDSGLCVQGVCCDTACKGQCESCAEPGSEGTCVPVPGDPPPGKPACNEAGADPACVGSCDGQNGGTCSYPAAGTACGEPACENGVATSSACDGQGRCVAASPEDCTPYACGASACRSSCGEDGDCAEGYVCNPDSNRCEPKPGGKCVEGDTVVEADDGKRTPCAPYWCTAGACGSSCSSTTQCQPGFVCDTARSPGACVAADEPAADEDAGCGCRAGGAGGGGGGAGLVAAAAALWLAGRRRSRGE